VGAFVPNVPSVWVDVILPIKSTGERNFPAELSRPIPVKRTLLKGKFVEETKPTISLRNSRMPNRAQ
jgi:hypothetical protein